MNETSPQGSPWKSQLELNKQVVDVVSNLSAGLKEVAELMQTLSERVIALEAKQCGCNKQVEI